MPAGRPLKFKTVKELQDKIDQYFETTGRQVDANGIEYFEPITITGLALALGTSRKVLMEYEDMRDEYSNTIKEAKLRCENFAEKMLYIGKSPTGAIFSLKNFNWTDKSQTELSGVNGAAIQVQNSLPTEDKDIINRYLQQRGAKE